MNRSKTIGIILVLAISPFLLNEVFAITTSNTLVLCMGGGSIFVPEEFTTSGFSTKFLQIDFTVDVNCNGISQDPTDGTWYGIVENQVNGRELVTFVPTTDLFVYPDGNGTGTPLNVIGGLGSPFDTDFYNSLAFNTTGTLFATSAKAHPVPNILSIVNKTSGLATQVCTLPANDNDRQNVFFNYNDEFLYVQTGLGVPTASNQKLFKITSVSGATCEVSEIVKPNQATLFPLGVETMGTAHNTNDNLIYTQGFYENATRFNPYYTISLAGALNIFDDDVAPTDSPNCNPDFFSGNFTAHPCGVASKKLALKGFAFELNLGADTTDPVITTTVSEPIPIREDSVFDEFEFVSCIDDTDGDITNTMSTVGTVDTSVPKSYFVDYTCTDVATNTSELQVQYLIKRLPSGSGGTAPSAPSPPSAPATGDGGTPLLSFTGEVDRAFDLFDALNSLFAPDEAVTPPAPTAPTAPTTPTPQVPRESFIDSIRSFFSSLFG